MVELNVENEMENGIQPNQSNYSNMGAIDWADDWLRSLIVGEYSHNIIRNRIG